MGKRSLSRLENRLSELEAERGAGDGNDVIVFREEIVETPWSDGRDDAPEPGVEKTEFEI